MKTEETRIIELEQKVEQLNQRRITMAESVRWVQTWAQEMEDENVDVACVN